MEIVETESPKQPELEKLTEQIKEMKEKIEMLEKEKYGKVAIELAKQLENINAEEEGTSEEPFVEVVSEIRSDEEDPGANVLSTLPVYAKAGGQNVENITNPKKFAKVMHNKRQAKEKRIAQEENKAELDKFKSGNFQQPARNPDDSLKYRRGLGKCGQVLNKALKEGKYVIDFQYGGVSLSNPCVQKYLAHMVPTLDEEVALMATELINRIYDEAGLEIETIRYYKLQFHVLQANLPEKLWNIFELQLAEWTTTRLPWKSYEAAVWACACLFMKLSRLGRIPQNFGGFHYQAHAYIAMKLLCEFNARQDGLGSNFQAMYSSCQARAAGLAYTIAKAILQDKKYPEPKYANIQVWKKETDNTDPRIRFWEVIDRKKVHDILEVEKSLKKKIGYRVKHAHNRPATSKVSKRWTIKRA
uniref:Uncharacterized protein n=1 Tax=Romanomermis culicivorax TaxID=13658 RepID=A0A915JVH1_ROMCU